MDVSILKSPLDLVPGLQAGSLADLLREQHLSFVVNNRRAHL